MKKLTEHHRKVLTEYLGECWHDRMDTYVDHGVDRKAYCLFCGKTWGRNTPTRQRTFTTPADLHAVYSRMVEIDKSRKTWDDFVEYAIGAYFGKHIREGITIKHSKFMRWLSCYGCPDQIPERMVLVVNFVEGRKGK